MLVDWPNYLIARMSREVLMLDFFNNLVVALIMQDLNYSTMLESNYYRFLKATPSLPLQIF
jgi:hypothetical protein